MNKDNKELKHNNPKGKIVLVTFTLILIISLFCSIPFTIEYQKEHQLSDDCKLASTLLTYTYKAMQRDALNKDLLNLNWNSGEDVIQELAKYVELFKIPNNTNAAQMANGMIIEIKGVSDDCTSIRGNTKSLKSVCATATIDVNGLGEPNKYGKDTFYFYLTRYGSVPAGLPSDTYAPLSECKITGVGCTAWVITKGDQSYRRHSIDWE